MQQPQLQRQISLSDTTGIVCEECGNSVFAQGVFLRKVSQFLTGESQDSLIPSPTFYCIKCNHVNKSFDINQQGVEEAELV